MTPDTSLVSRKESLDVSKIFLAYAATAGDLLATAQLAECAMDDVLFLERTENWPQKIMRMQITKAANPEMARAQNRMACYIQAIRLRGLIDQTLKQIYDNPDNVSKFCTEVAKNGKPFFSTKPIRELVESSAKVHELLYRSLGDVITKEEGAGSGASVLNGLKELHFTVIQHLNSVGGSAPEKPALEDARVKLGPADAESAFLTVDDALSDPTPPAPGTSSAQIRK